MTPDLEAALKGLDHRSGALPSGTPVDAWLSPDDTYRYLLTCGSLDDLTDEHTPLVAFVMLNPSTADHVTDDRTFAKCRSFAARYAGLVGASLPIHHQVAIVNLYAVRTKDPKIAFAHPRPIGGQQNDRVILAVAKAADVVIAAWGSDKRSAGRAAEVRRMLVEAGVKLNRIGPASKGGHPQHPLYLRGDLELEAA